MNLLKLYLAFYFNKKKFFVQLTILTINVSSNEDTGLTGLITSNLKILLEIEKLRTFIHNETA